MDTARLELISFELLLKKERWAIYFILATKHPTEKGKYILTIVPDTGTIPLRKLADNKFSFRPEGVGADGFSIIETEIERNETTRAHMYMMHSRSGVRKFGEILGEIKDEIIKDGTLISSITNIAASKSPQWILIDKGFDFIQNILKNTKDRNLGLVSLDDDFGKEFDKNLYQERSNTLSTGNAKITWSWSIR